MQTEENSPTHSMPPVLVLIPSLTYNSAPIVFFSAARKESAEANKESFMISSFDEFRVGQSRGAE